MSIWYLKMGVTFKYSSCSLSWLDICPIKFQLDFQLYTLIAQIGEVEGKWERGISPNNVYGGVIKQAMTHWIKAWWQGPLKGLTHCRGKGDGKGSPRVWSRLEYPPGLPILQWERLVRLRSTWRYGSFSCWIDSVSHLPRCLLPHLVQSYTTETIIVIYNYFLRLIMRCVLQLAGNAWPKLWWWVSKKDALASFNFPFRGRACAECEATVVGYCSSHRGGQ